MTASPPASPMVIRTRGEIEVAGQVIEFAWSTPAEPSGAPIVLLHEGLGSVAAWRDFPEVLAASTGRAVFSYSRPGYGQSALPPATRTADFLHREALEVLPAVLECVGLQRPILYGHSDGASIALIYAGAAERAAALVLEAPHVFVEPVTVTRIAELTQRFETADLAAKLAGLHRDPRATFHSWSGVWLSEAFRTWNIEAAADGLRTPTLLIQGDADEYGSLTHVDSIARRAPQAQLLLLPGCGHLPHRAEPQAVLAAVGAFLAKTEERAAP